jgi:hypothetical protein
MGSFGKVTAAGVLVLTLLAGCSGGSGESAEPSQSSGGQSLAPQSPGGSMSTGSPLSPSPGSSAAEMTLTGDVFDGVEPGCLLLRASGRDYLLVLPKSVDRAAVRAGARLTVRGRIQSGLVSYCQQGTPLVVSEVRPA